MRTVIWQTLKWKPGRKMCWLKSIVFKQLNSAKDNDYEQGPEPISIRRKRTAVSKHFRFRQRRADHHRFGNGLRAGGESCGMQDARLRPRRIYRTAPDRLHTRRQSTWFQ